MMNDEKMNIIDVGCMQVQIFLPGQLIPTEVIRPKLSHGTRMVEVATGTEDLGNCDAIYTENQKLILGFSTADCAAICLGDQKRIGIAHIGWPGLSLGLVEKILEKFDTIDTSVYVSPFMHSFEIQKDFCYDALAPKFEKYIEEVPDGKLIFHFKDAIASLLPPGTIFDSRNTFLDQTLPSFRRNKTKDRMYTAVRFLKEN